MPSLISYEAQHRQNLNVYSRQIKQVYHKYIDLIYQQSNLVTELGGKPFNLDDFPVFRKAVDDLTKEMAGDLEGVITSGCKYEWELANAKNDFLAQSALKSISVKSSDLPAPVYERFFNKNIPAMDAFITRKHEGLHLSETIWKKVIQFRQEIEVGLQDGITHGKSAASMATQLKVHLNDPGRLFRRVRDEQGILRLSRAAQAYKPGQGKYRSSYKNALRLTRTETNMAYRAADHERWNKMDFILGFEVKLSASHPVYDICDIAAGRYPKAFKFIGWHPQCLCYAVPILLGEDEFGNYIDLIMEGEEMRVTGHVQDIPGDLKGWVKDNADRIRGWKETPYFIKDNRKFWEG